MSQRLEVAIHRGDQKLGGRTIRASDALELGAMVIALLEGETAEASVRVRVLDSIDPLGAGKRREAVKS